jgi:hypothetical protein
MYLHHGTHAIENYEAPGNNDWQRDQDTDPDSNGHDEEVQKVPSRG